MGFVSWLGNPCPYQLIFQGRRLPVSDHEVSVQNLLWHYICPDYAQCLEMSSLKLGLALLYVVMNISGTSLASLFSIFNSFSLLDFLVSIQAFDMISWGYSLHLKNKYVCICDSSKC